MNAQRFGTAAVFCLGLVCQMAMATESDDFFGGPLDAGLWTVVDPVGDGTVETTGAGTADAQLLLLVPAGTNHDVWTAGNRALRVMQSAADTDFEIEVKFESEPTQKYQLQGLLIEQDAENFLRLDFYSDGKKLRVFAARFVGGVPTTLINQSIGTSPLLYLRLTRQGDGWTPQYSYDGTSWNALSSFTHALTVSAVGVFAGNAGANPAYTAVVDYFFNAAEPIVPEDGLLCAPGETFSLTTSVLGAGTLLREPDQSSYSCGESLTLTAQPDVGWAFVGWGGVVTGTDNPMMLTMEADADVTADFAADTTESPLALDDAYATDQETALVVASADGVLSNDTDTSSPADLTAALETPPTQGTLTNFGSDGGFSYVPNAGFHGTDSFTYAAVDGVSGARAEATVTLLVNAVNQAPVAADDSYQTLPDTPLDVGGSIGVLANDTDADLDVLQAVLVGDVSNGVLSLTADGAFSYTPNTGFIGTDSFTYQAGDGALLSDVATATISVDVINNPPKIVSGRISFTKQVIDDQVNQTHAVVAADFNGDALIDLAATDYVDGMVFWYENDGVGGFVTRTLDADLAGAYPAHVGDVDGDGDIDILAAGYLADTVAWYENDGLGGFTRRDVDVAADGAHSVVTGDMDQDGDVDLLTTNQDANTVTWYENDGSNAFARRTIDTTAEGAKRAEFADVDGDGDLDVFSASYFANEIAWHENDGNQLFSKRVIDATARGAYYVFPADIDGDNDIDVFAAIQLTDTIAWYENNGSGSFTKHVIDGGALKARTVIGHDIDGDGDADAIAASVDDDTVAVYLNDGTGNFFAKEVVDLDADGAYGVYALDIDGDGYSDVLSASKDANAVAIHAQIKEHVILGESGGAVVIDDAVLLASDTDNAPAELIYSITDAPDYGSLELKGSPVLAGGEFTQEDINKGDLVYRHAGTAGSDAFSFTVDDGIGRASNPSAGAFAIRIATGGGIVSDDFQGSVLDTGLWTFVDPVGDGDYALDGAGTSDARLLLSVPAGTDHDVWTAGNRAVRVMQPSPNEDFEIEVKFESQPSQKYQMQGLLIEQDASNFLRVDFVSDGTSLYLFAAGFVDGVPTTYRNQKIQPGGVLYLRLSREGDTWTPRYSNDGTNWWTVGGRFSHTLTVSSVGVFAGNAGGKPAYTAAVDYVFNTLEPIVPEDGLSLSCTAGETFLLTTDASGAGAVLRDPDQASYDCGQSVTLTAQPDAGAEFVGWSGALNGGTTPAVLTIEAETLVTAEFASDTTPPVISNVQVTAGETSATLSWETDEPATSTVAYGEITPDALTVDAATVPTTTHSVTLTDLIPATSYHYQVTATDAAGNSSATADAVFTTADDALGGGGGIVSDDFQAATLDTGLWTIVDPVGDGTVEITGAGTADARLLLSVPAGTNHDIWTAGNRSLRVMQAAANEDFEIAVKFESEPTQKHQMQGLLIEQDAGNFVRVDFVSDGSTLRLYAIRFVAGSPTVLVNQVVTGAQVLHLRLTRVGDQWTPAYSFDGASWSAASSFTHALSVSAVGVFAGNAGGNPAHTAVIDYFFNTLEPIVPEDGLSLSCTAGETFLLTTDASGAGTVLRDPDQASYDCGQSVSLTAQPDAGAEFVGWSGALDGSTNPAVLTIEAETLVTAEFASDTTPPVISNVQVTAGETSATLSLETDEPATSTVAYGEGTGYELGLVDAATAPSTTHSVTLSNLTAATTYHYQITVTDPGGNSTATADAVFDTLAEGSANPLIDVWYGPYQPCGYLGIPQQWINVLGHVTDPDGIASLSYSLNGRPSQVLAMGPDDRRLADEGDFVVEIDYADPDLAVGLNSVVISATDGVGNTSVVGVDVDFGGAGNVWPLPYSVDWDAVSNLQDVVQVVDGDWALVPDGIRTTQIDYDRLLAIGDMSWQNYEITVPITVHGSETPGSWTSGDPGVGLILRWTGHTDNPVFCAQPHCGWLPSGPIAWWRSGEFSLGSAVDANVQLQQGVRYFWKLRVETQTTGEHWYSLKVWEDGDFEPLKWNLQTVRSAADIAAGSALLIAHHTDVTFGDIAITPLAAPSPPPVITDVQVVVSDTAAEVSWMTDQPATSRVDYGLSSSHELGAVTDETLKTSHSLILSALQPGTLYYFQIASVTEGGSVATTGDSTFTTTGGQDFSGIVSDDFSSGGLDTGLWTVVDPVGDGTVAVAGAGTADARMLLSLPAGTSHDIWTSGNDALRVIQPAADEDLDIAVKFESEPIQGYQMQGLLVEQDAENFLRLDFYSDGSQLLVFSARFVGGVPTTLINQSIATNQLLYLRLTRQGDGWTPQYSYDGASWNVLGSFTHALNVSAVGVFAGNAGTNPANTVVVDYFFNTFEPIVPEDGAAP